MPPLELIGLIVRGARLKRDLTQQRAAKLAGVSRKQWALLEQGENVSVVFLQKVMRALGLKQCPLAEDLEATTTATRGITADELFRLSAELALIVERIERVAFEAALPPSERSGDAAAIDAYLRESDGLPAATLTRVREILHRTASEGAAAAPSQPPSTRVRKREPSQRKRRA